MDIDTNPKQRSNKAFPRFLVLVMCDGPLTYLEKVSLALKSQYDQTIL